MARRIDLSLMRALAVRFFAGVQASETNQIREDVINTARGEMKIPAAIAKTRSRRLVTIQPNLAAWLDVGGALPLHNPNTRLARVTNAVRTADIAWPMNVTRHSFCSYHIAAFENAERTALESGHSEAMLFAHYRALATPEAAREWFGIFPADGQLALYLAA